MEPFPRSLGLSLTHSPSKSLTHPRTHSLHALLHALPKASQNPRSTERQSRHNKASVPRIGVAPRHCPRWHFSALQLSDSISLLSYLAVAVAELTMIAPSSCTRPPFVTYRHRPSDSAETMRTLQHFSCSKIIPPEERNPHGDARRSGRCPLPSESAGTGKAGGVGCVVVGVARPPAGDRGPETRPEEDEGGPEHSKLWAPFLPLRRTKRAFGWPGREDWRDFP